MTRDRKVLRLRTVISGVVLVVAVAGGVLWSVGGAEYTELFVIGDDAVLLVSGPDRDDVVRAAVATAASETGEVVTAGVRWRGERRAVTRASMVMGSVFALRGMELAWFSREAGRLVVEVVDLATGRHRARVSMLPRAFGRDAPDPTMKYLDKAHVQFFGDTVVATYTTYDSRGDSSVNVFGVATIQPDVAGTPSFAASGLLNGHAGEPAVTACHVLFPYAYERGVSFERDDCPSARLAEAERATFRDSTGRPRGLSVLRSEEGGLLMLSTPADDPAEVWLYQPGALTPVWSTERHGESVAELRCEDGERRRAIRFHDGVAFGDRVALLVEVSGSCAGQRELLSKGTLEPQDDYRVVVIELETGHVASVEAVDVHSGPGLPQFVLRDQEPRRSLLATLRDMRGSAEAVIHVAAGSGDVQVADPSRCSGTCVVVGGGHGSSFAVTLSEVQGLDVTLGPDLGAGERLAMTDPVGSIHRIGRTPEESRPAVVPKDIAYIFDGRRRGRPTPRWALGGSSVWTLDDGAVNKWRLK